jgi:hypothetical protein
MKLEYGKRYVMRNGYVTAPLVSNTDKYLTLNENFAFVDPKSGYSFTSNGSRFLFQSHQTTDLVEEFIPKTLNFWEAREASKQGKIVKGFLAGAWQQYTSKEFEHEVWDDLDMTSEWEIVEKPKVFKSYLNVYEDGHGQAWNTKGQADTERTCTKTNGCIEIITDENGKLISARNI